MESSLNVYNSDFYPRRSIHSVNLHPFSNYHCRNFFSRFFHVIDGLWTRFPPLFFPSLLITPHPSDFPPYLIYQSRQYKGYFTHSLNIIEGDIYSVLNRSGPCMSKQRESDCINRRKKNLVYLLVILHRYPYN